MVDVEVDEFPGGIQPGDEHQRRVVEAVGQVHQLGDVRQNGGPCSAVGMVRGGRLQGVRTQLGQGLDLTDDLRRLRFERCGPDDLQYAVDPAARARRHGDPAAVGVVAPADGGQPGLRQATDPLARSLTEPTTRHGCHAGRHISPAPRLGDRESRAARQSERPVAAQRPDGHCFRAEGFQRVLHQGVGHGLGVAGGQRCALGGPEPYGGGVAPRRGGGFGARGGGEEGGGHFGEPVTRGLVDDLDGELERCHACLLGQLGELSRSLRRPAPEPLDEDALGQLEQGTPVRGRLSRPHLPAQPFHGRGEPADGGGVIVSDLSFHVGLSSEVAAAGDGYGHGPADGKAFAVFRRNTGGFRPGRLMGMGHG